MTRLWLLLALVWLGGCAIITVPEPAPPGVKNPDAWRAHRAAIQGLQQWSLQGRAASGQVLGWTGNISWRQRGKTFHVRVSGPLGMGGFRADGTLARVTVRTGEQTFKTTRPGALVEEILGWRFPLTGLRYWVLGLPEPGVPALLSVNSRGLLITLQQSGWELGYAEYTKVAGYRLPSRIVLHNSENTISVVIGRWFGLGGGKD